MNRISKSAVAVSISALGLLAVGCAGTSMTIPDSYEHLTVEQKSWRDERGVISCKEHAKFPGCSDNPNYGYVYPDDNTAFTIENTPGASEITSGSVDIVR